MKKFVFGVFTLLLAIATLNAQEEAEKAVKKAGKALSSYNLDPTNNQEKLKEAVEMADLGVSSPGMANNFSAWQTRGEVYNGVASNEMSAQTLSELKGEQYQLKNLDAPVKALESFEKALKAAEKKYETKDALKGIKETVNYLNVFSNPLLEAGDYAGAFPLLNGVLTARKLLMDNGEKDIFAEAKDLNNHRFVVAYCAQASGNKAVAKELFKTLVDAGHDEARIYSNYYRLLAEENDPNAMKILEMGRAKYPDNSEILFAEINEYIKAEKYDLLEQKLKEAIAKEPDNPSIYSALGNVYMNLQSAELEKGDKAKAEIYYEQSKKYYNDALAIDPNLFDAIYSLGSIYFNQAVEIVKKMNNLGLSKEDQKKYNEMGKEVDVLFDKALPYFQKAEKLNPNDTNTLIALREIFARRSDFEKSNEFKKRLEKVQSGGTNDKPYFNQ